MMQLNQDEAELAAGLAEIKRMEYLMSKAPCLARLDELAAYAAKDEEQDEFRAKGGYYSGYQDD